MARVGRMLLCVTGGYQAYATPGFVLALLRHFADDVDVVLSRAASRLVSTYAVEVACRHPVFVEMEDTSADVFVPHIELSRRAELVLVYPATVNVLAKVAQGIADELIPALVLAATAPVVFLPVTNQQMADHPAVKRNLATLKADGYHVLEPLEAVEVATREGLAHAREPFPLPTLLVQMSAAVVPGASLGRPKREPTA